MARLFEDSIVLAAQYIVLLCGIYAALGIIFAATFVCAGVARLDPLAKGSSIGFRLIIFPGSAALWPYLLMRWLRKKP